MRKILLCLSLVFMMIPVSAHDIWDVFDEKISISEYIDEYSELKPVQQFEKFRNDCKEVAIEYTMGIYDLVYYEPKSMFERFKPPYLKSKFIKSIIKGNISELKFWVHSPFYSPINNITCNCEGKQIKYKLLNFDAGYAKYLISFDLELKKGVTKVDEILETIKTSLPALNNSHLTPYDCKNLLPEGQYAEVIDNKM